MSPRAAVTEVHGFVPARAGPRPAFPGCAVAGTGEAVVMLHASLASKSQWATLAKRMLGRFRMIALDLAGYGDVAMPATAEPFTLDDEVRLVAGHLARLVAPHERVHLVGHSYGGLVALRFAQSMGERVASMSLYEPVAFGVLERSDPALASVSEIAGHVAELLAAGRRQHAARAFVDFWSGEGSFAALPERAQASAMRTIDKVTLDFQAAHEWRPDPDTLRAIALPALLMSGTRSPGVAQRITAELARTLGNRRIASFEAGHMGPITDPNAVNPWFEAFVDMHAQRDRRRGAHGTYFTTASHWYAAD